MKKIFTIILFLFFSSHVFAQLIIENAGVPAGEYVQWLVKNILVGKDNEVSNITFKGKCYGSSTAIAKFTTGNNPTNIGIKEGIILSTGNAINVAGANSKGYNLSTNWGLKGDNDLDNYYDQKTMDAAVLEFDIIPISNEISFNYVFASEEYPEYVNSGYSDIFAFFITGPKPIGGNYNKQNIALIPNTTLDINVNNINNNFYSQYYVNNENGSATKFNGFTKVLSAQADVIPNSTYHIKIVITDVGDESFDSGVFFEANNLAVDSIFHQEVTTITTKDTFFCSGNTLKINVTGANTYIWSNGDTSKSITITPTETTVYKVTGTTEGFTSSDELIVVVNQKPLANAGNDQTIAIGQYAILTVSGGKYYTWDNGLSTKSITVSPTQTTTYKVTTMSEACFETDEVVVFVFSCTKITTDDIQICSGTQITINATISDYYLWSNGSTSKSIKVTPTQTTIYKVTGTNNGFTSSDEVVVTVYQNPIANAGEDKTITSGKIVILNASGGENYIWSNGSFSKSIQEIPTQTTTYRVTAISGVCSDIDEVIVFVDQKVSINEIKANNSSINIYPNPSTNGVVNIAIENIEYPFNITITDAIGKTIQCNQIKEDFKSSSFNFQNVENGIY